ncbi:MAG: gluconokinase [Caulobacteraceae bacterium]|nr:gluconokinase [Caulobacteraceae bacterium]
MGVSGAGKSTVGEALAHRLGWAFLEGDSLHPQANIAKMARGHPLNDADRAPWLEAIGDWIDRQASAGGEGVVACSALKRVYRDELRRGRPQVRLIYLEGAIGLIGQRLRARRHAYMPPSLLRSQFADLEPPTPDEHALTVDFDLSIPEQLNLIIGWLAEGEGA